MDIILYLLSLCQQLYQQNRMLLGLLCRYVPLRQWAFDDSHSPKYEKFKTDELPKIIPIPHKDWKHLTREYQRTHNGKILAPVRRRKGCMIPADTRCPCCNAPADYIYRNNGSKGQFLWPRKTVSKKLMNCAVLSVHIPWSQSKTGRNSASGSVSIAAALITRTISRKSIRIPRTGSAITSSITCTANSLSIFLR